MEKVVDAVVGLSILTSDATNRKTVRLIGVVLWPDVGAVEA